ncbi:AAHS family benzoate transporter-like MFS transporter [Novosphingobium sp. SG751A]|nr:AAHS family benzoate transporter-like MFS transporter [Novosphingobium sp. SG751A]
MTMPFPPESRLRSGRPWYCRPRLIIWICWFGLFSEGYDMGVLGAVLPGLLNDPAWHLGPTSASLLASAAMAGMFFGGYGFGVLSDRFGRKTCFIACLTLFSITSAAAAAAPTPLFFAAMRFLAGIGIGGIVPVAAAFACEFAPRGKINREFAIMYSGYSLGIFAAALASFFLLQNAGWRPIVALGAAPLVLLPAILWLLPESAAYLMGKGRYEKADDIARRYGLDPADLAPPPAEGAIKPGVRALFADGHARATLGFWLTTFTGMILVYGLNTWLPQIMRASGYDLGPSIMFLGVFALASSVGGIMLGRLADRHGRAPIIVAAFCGGAVAILLLSHKWPLMMTYGIVALAGVGTVSAAVMVTSYLSQYFSPALRATAVGSCLSFSRMGSICGPLLGGMIATYQLDMAWNFIGFAAVAALSALAIALVPRQEGESEAVAACAA